MFAVTSSHKRKRSSARREASHNKVTPARTIVTHVSSFLIKGKGKAIDETVPERLQRIMGAHPFMHELHILLPLTGDVEQASLPRGLPAPSALLSYMARISPCLFLDTLFVTAHLKRGRLLALSVGRLDQDDVFCIDGRGTLHLHLTKDTYQSLGLVGQSLKASQSASGWAADRLSGAPERFYVTVDLTAPSFTPGRPAYDRTLACFKAWDVARGDTAHTGSWDVLMSWSEDTVGAEQGGQMHFPSRYCEKETVRTLYAEQRVEAMNDVWIPDLAKTPLRRKWSHTSDDKKTAWSGWLEEEESVTEWAALVAMGAESVRTFARPDHVNAYSVAEPRTPGTVLHVCYRGFLPTGLGAKVAHVAQCGLQTEEKPFAVVHATGFADAPVAWLVAHSAGPKGVTVEPSPSDDDDVGDQSQSEGEVDEAHAAGLAVRRKRSKKRRQRGFTRAEHLGVQVRNPFSQATATGWQSLLLPQVAGEAASCIIAENVGDTQRS